MDEIDALAVLRDPVRRRLYDHVVASGGEVSRNEAAEATGVARTLAAFHLDKLADAGLLTTTSRRLGGKSGPGAGRPSKLYRRSPAEYRFAIPPRDDGTVAELLAEVAEVARLDVELQATARRRGQADRALVGPVTDLTSAATALATRGYEPHVDETGVLRLTNCPFRVVSQQHPGLVCGMNLALLEGFLDGSDGLRARLDPRPGYCCVAVDPSIDNDD